MICVWGIILISAACLRVRCRQANEIGVTGTHGVLNASSQALVEEVRQAGLLVAVEPIPPTRSRFHVGLSGASVADETADGGSYQLLAEGAVPTDAKTIRVLAPAIYNKSIVDKLAELARRGGTPYPLVYDKVVRALGWTHDGGVYDASTAPTMQPNGAARRKPSNALVRLA